MREVVPVPDPRLLLSRRVFGAVTAASVLAACSSQGATKASTPSTASIATPAVTDAATTTEATVATPATDAVTTTSVEPITTLPALPPMPLTGLPTIFEDAAKRPAIVVKIDNHPDARPQSGLNGADIVFEENVENLTRFAAVFHGGNANPVGPIRSGRTQDVALLGSLNRPMFIWSGGNPRVSQAIRGSDLRQIADQGGKGFYRSNNRESPHNLYNSTDAIYALAPLDATAPPPQFEYRDAGGSITGDDVEGVKISMDGVRVLWKWDINLAVFLRSSDDKPHIDANDGAQLNTQNVVVLFVKYVASAADRSSPEAQTIGSGSVTVLSGGKAVQGTWTRADRLNPFTLTDANGSPILLSPGRTYVELARADTAAIIPANVDPGTIRYP